MKSLKTIFGISALAIFAGFLGFTNTNAESASQGMQISPTLIELNAVAGATYDIKLNVMNITPSDLFYISSVDDFNSTDETSSPHIITDDLLSDAASIKTWVSSIDDFTLASNKSKEIKVSISVPSNAEPGGHYGVIRFSGSAPTLEKAGVGLSASAGTLILIRVDGDIVEKASLASFYSSKKGDQSFLFEKGNITFVTRIKNEGNVHVKPVGTIEISNMFGKVVKTIKVNEESSNVLPKSIRRFETEFKKDGMFGKYTANLALAYGSQGQAITNTISFWVIPYKLVIAVLFGLALLVFVLSKLLKSYNSHIIKKANNEKSHKKASPKKK